MLSRLQGKPRMGRADNRWVNRLTIEPQTFCGLKEIEQKKPGRYNEKTNSV